MLQVPSTFIFSWLAKEFDQLLFTEECLHLQSSLTDRKVNEITGEPSMFPLHVHAVKYKGTHSICLQEYPQNFSEEKDSLCSMGASIFQVFLSRFRKEGITVGFPEDQVL